LSGDALRALVARRGAWPAICSLNRAGFSAFIDSHPGEVVVHVGAIGCLLTEHRPFECRRIEERRCHENRLIERAEDFDDCFCECAERICVCGAPCCICAAPSELHLVPPQHAHPPFSLSLTAQYVEFTASVQRFMIGEHPLAMLLRLRQEWSLRYHAGPAPTRLDLRV
jgi:hypothetical protein